RRRRSARSAVRVSSAMSSRVGGGAPFSECQRAVRSVPCSVQLIIGIRRSPDLFPARAGDRDGVGARALLATRTSRRQEPSIPGAVPGGAGTSRGDLEHLLVHAAEPAAAL